MLSNISFSLFHTKTWTTGTLHLHLYISHSHGDCWGTMNLATLSLPLILFSASLRVLQNCPLRDIYFPNASFVGPFFSLLALFLVKLSWRALLILIRAQTTFTCVSLPWLIYHHRAQWLA